jgi:hypothetical protein
VLCLMWGREAQIVLHNISLMILTISLILLRLFSWILNEVFHFRL